MKFSLILTGVLMAGSVAMYSQNAEDSTVYITGINKINQARTLADCNNAARYFEELAGKDPGYWLGPYYAAYCYIQASYKTEENKTRDALLDKAQNWIDKADKQTTQEPELIILQAFLYQSRIQVNPALRGMSYSSKADARLKKAVSVDGDNPRAWSLLGYNMYYTPVMFGGGAEKALPLFIKAKDKYNSYRPPSSISPQWGQPENEQMIALCKKAINQAGN